MSAEMTARDIYWACGLRDSVNVFDIEHNAKVIRRAINEALAVRHSQTENGAPFDEELDKDKARHRCGFAGEPGDTSKMEGDV